MAQPPPPAADGSGKLVIDLRALPGVVIISSSLAAAVVIMENFQYRGLFIQWLWSLTGWAPMPREVAISLGIVLLTNIFAVFGLCRLRKASPKPPSP